MFRFHLLFIAFTLFPTFLHADYTIDDSNYSVLKFSENPSGPVWGPFGSDTGEVLEIRLPNGTMQTIDATQCYDGTYTYAACSASNNCAVQFSFTGSGITIYVLRAGPQGMSASLSIDSGAATTATLDAPPSPQYYIPHAVLFDVQNVPSGTHSAVMTVLDWNGGFSGMMLDYIDVNQAIVSGPVGTSSSPPSSTPSSNTPTQSSSPSTPTPTPTPTLASSQGTSQQTSSIGAATSVEVASVVSVFSSQSPGTTALPSSTSSGGDPSSANSSSQTSKKANVAAIAGGAAGGAAGLLALLALGFCCLRRRRRQYLQTLNERPSPLLLSHPEVGHTNADPTITDPFAVTSPLARTPRPLQTMTELGAASILDITGQDQWSSSPINNTSHARAGSGSSIGGASSIRASIDATGIATTSPDRSSPMAHPYSPVRPALISYPNEKSQGPSSTSMGGLQQEPTASLDVTGIHPNAALTPEQVDFVNSLFNNNVPAPVVARVVERMLASPQGPGNVSFNDPEVRLAIDPGNLPALPRTQTQAPAEALSWLPSVNDHGDGETIETAPPSYDYVQAQ